MTTKTRRLRAQASHHAGEILRVNRHPVSWSWMLICGFTAMTPLIVGAFNHEVGLAIFGALTGYLIGLCDHQGTFRHRITIATLSLLLCELGFIVGVLTQHSLLSFAAWSVLLVYPLGLFGGKGAELERIFVFCGLELFVARYATSISKAIIPELSLYFVVAYVTALIGITFFKLTLKEAPQDFTHVKQAYRELFTRDRSRHFYAATFAVAILCGIFLVERYKIERGYWLLVTILLMMKPSRKETIYRIFQRMFGTLLGVLVGQLTVSFQVPIPILITGVFVFAALVPYVWHRNYWLVSFCATNLVICLLSILQYGHVDTSITLTRLRVTVGGCLVSLVVIFMARTVERLIDFSGPASSS